jgi:glycosyltransferase involved in cell wall biosynthesis
VLEAAAAAVPIVATAVGGLPTAAKGWDTVSLVSVDAASLADGVRRAVVAPPSVGQLAAVRDDVLVTYGFETNLDSLAEVYRDVNRCSPG